MVDPKDKSAPISWKQVSTPLTASDVVLARKFRLFILVRNLLVQHKEDGGNIIPAGRMVFILSPSTPPMADEYSCKTIYIAAPDRLDFQTEMKDGSSLPPGVIRLKPPRKTTFRILVAPAGKEKEWLDISVSKSLKSLPAR